MTKTNNDIIVPGKVFRQGILKVIKDRTGKKIPLETFDRFDESVFGKLIGINKVRVTIIPRLFHRVFCLKRTYDKAVANAWLMEKDFN